MDRGLVDLSFTENEIWFLRIVVVAFMSFIYLRS